MTNEASLNTVADYIKRITVLLHGASVSPENIRMSMIDDLTTDYPRIDGILCEPTSTTYQFSGSTGNTIKSQKKIVNIYKATVRQTSPVLLNNQPRRISVQMLPDPNAYSNIVIQRQQGEPSMLIWFNNNIILYPFIDGRSYEVVTHGHWSLMEFNESLTDDVIARIPENNRQLFLYSFAYHLSVLLDLSERDQLRLKNLKNEQKANLSPLPSVYANRGGCDIAHMGSSGIGSYLL